MRGNFKNAKSLIVKVLTYRSKAGVVTNVVTLLEKIVQRKI